MVKDLKQLESRGILLREAFATVPPTVEYSLSEKGLSLKPLLLAVQDWAVKNMAV